MKGKTVRTKINRPDAGSCSKVSADSPITYKASPNPSRCPERAVGFLLEERGTAFLTGQR
jgi:hypothetical protein